MRILQWYIAEPYITQLLSVHTYDIIRGVCHSLQITIDLSQHSHFKGSLWHWSYTILQVVYTQVSAAIDDAPWSLPQLWFPYLRDLLDCYSPQGLSIAKFLQAIWISSFPQILKTVIISCSPHAISNYSCWRCGQEDGFQVYLLATSYLKQSLPLGLESSPVLDWIFRGLTQYSLRGADRDNFLTAAL